MTTMRELQYYAERIEQLRLMNKRRLIRAINQEEYHLVEKLMKRVLFQTRQSKLLSLKLKVLQSCQEQQHQIYIYDEGEEKGFSVVSCKDISDFFTQLAELQTGNSIYCTSKLFGEVLR